MWFYSEMPACLTTNVYANKCSRRQDSQKLKWAAAHQLLGIRKENYIKHVGELKRKDRLKDSCNRKRCKDCLISSVCTQSLPQAIIKAAWRRRENIHWMLALISSSEWKLTRGLQSMCINSLLIPAHPLSKNTLQAFWHWPAFINVVWLHCLLLKSNSVFELNKMLLSPLHAFFVSSMQTTGYENLKASL